MTNRPIAPVLAAAVVLAVATAQPLAETAALRTELNGYASKYAGVRCGTGYQFNRERGTKTNADLEAIYMGFLRSLNTERRPRRIFYNADLLGDRFWVLAVGLRGNSFVYGSLKGGRIRLMQCQVRLG